MLSKEASGRKEDINLIIIITVVYIINVFSVEFPIIGILIGVFAIIILLILFFSGQLESYILYLILFMTTGFEVSAFALYEGEIYSFLKLPGLGSYHIFFLSILPTLLFTRKKAKFYLNEINKFGDLSKYNKGMFWLIIIGIIFGLLSLLFNDNDVQNSSIHFSHTRQELISFVSVFLLGLYISFFLVSSPQFSNKLERLLRCILVSLLPSSIITIILGLHGYYSGNKTILMPLVIFFGVTLMIFPFYSDYFNRKRYFFNGFILFLIILIFPSPLGGKWWLLIMIIPTIWIINTLYRLNVKKLIYLNFILPIAIILIITFSLIDHSGQKWENNLSQKKFDQAISSFNIWENNWFENLPNSPKFRIDEFINILFEYNEKPQYLLFGKGFGGSLTQHTSFLDWNQTDAFSIEQIREGRYFRLHFALNKIFLKFGLIGLFYYISIFILCLKGIKKNPWVLLGLIWFLMYFDYYISLNFGLFCLLLGLFKNEKKRKLYLKK